MCRGGGACAARTVAANENSRPRVCRGRRLSAVELQLPQLRRSARGNPEGARQNAVIHRGRPCDDCGSWVLVNASPDILAQLRAHPDFQPGRSPRDTAICAIVLVDGQVDHTTGLYMLRESTRAWPLWCTDAVYADLTLGNPILEVLSHYCRIERRRMALEGTRLQRRGARGCPLACPARRGQARPLLPQSRVSRGR